ncbi:hypothetical protein M514_08022 [Trichuris suis]|uniref:Uncharacterized protein n=1 Tax=Trichuris suis TaxID=68888 RepID=A0A085NTL9_9BILA|nr:hypothetical protein M514_08022 [Trichuris suis]
MIKTSRKGSASFSSFSIMNITYSGMMLLKNLKMVLLFLCFITARMSSTERLKIRGVTSVCCISKFFLSRLSIKTSASTGDSGLPIGIHFKTRTTYYATKCHKVILFVTADDG